MLFHSGGLETDWGMVVVDTVDGAYEPADDGEYEPADLSPVAAGAAGRAWVDTTGGRSGAIVEAGEYE